MDLSLPMVGDVVRPPWPRYTRFLYAHAILRVTWNTSAAGMRNPGTKPATPLFSSLCGKDPESQSGSFPIGSTRTFEFLSKNR